MSSQAQDLFDDIIDPYADTFQQGKEDGRKAAFQAGYNDGYQLGKLKSLEIGVELGYMSSICMMTLQHLEGKNEQTVDDNSQSNNVEESILERKRKIRLQDLMKAIEEFPKPETIFQKDDSDLMKEENSISKTQSIQNINGSSNNFGETDIVSTIQRLRAKFKAILVQNNLSYLRLKDVMDSVDNVKRSMGDSHENSMNKATEGDVMSRIDEW